MKQSVVAVLEKIKAEDLIESVPSVSPLNGKILRSLVLASGAKNMLELGTARGYSTIWIASALEVTGGKLTTIDYSEPTLMEAIKHIQEAGYSHIVETKLGNARKYFEDFAPESFDAIFLDSEKKATAEFFRICWGLLKSGGWIIVDDVQKFAHKMVGFTETLEELGVDAEYLPTDADDSILFARKP